MHISLEINKVYVKPLNYGFEQLQSNASAWWETWMNTNCLITIFYLSE